MDASAPLDLENPAWGFALDFYGRPGVAEACLALQDQLDADIVELVVILYAWSKRGISLARAEGAELRARMQGWRETTVLPLRHIRRALKPPRSDMPPKTKEILRDRVKQAELLAEQIQIAWAEDWLGHVDRAGRSTDLHPVPAWFLAPPNGEPVPESCNREIAVIAQTAIDMKQ